MNVGKKKLMELPVQYGNVNIGDKTARIGCNVKRPTLTPTIADKNLCDKRLTAKILARTSGGADQESIPGMDQDVNVEAVFDCKGFGVSKKAISFGLTFM